MDDGELDFSNRDVFSNLNIGDPQFLSSCFQDSEWDFNEIFKDTHACRHTHTCNPPGPDLAHTHTCFHVHTKIRSTATDDKTTTTDDTAESNEKSSKKRPLGNREAVRKYREKKKARAASLEDEVVRLRALNQQLMKRLQAQAGLETEVARLKCLLVDIRGRIEGEIGSFPYQKLGKVGDGISNLGGGYVLNSCDLRCDNQVHCLHPGVEGKGGETGASDQGFTACDISSVQCPGDPNLGSKELLGCRSGNVVPTGGVPLSAASKRKGTRGSTSS